MAGRVYLILVSVAIIVSIIVASFIQDLDTDSIIVLSLLGIVMQLSYFAVFILFAEYKGLRGKKLLEYYDIKKSVRPSDGILLLLLGVICIVTFLSLQTVSIEMFSRMGYGAEVLDISMDNVWEFLLVLVAIAVIPSIVEEVVFRGLIFKELERFGVVVAVVLSSALFSLFHHSPTQTVYQFFFGVILALVYVRSRNLLYPIILHFVNNALIVTYTFVTQGYADGTLNLDAQTWFVTILLAVFGMVVIHKMIKLLKVSANDSEPVAPAREKLIGKFVEWDTLFLFFGIGLSMLLWGMAFNM